MPKPRMTANGYLFPVPHRLIGRLFSGSKDVFVKQSRYRLLTEGSTLVFYDSGEGSKLIVGEAKIKKIIFDDPAKIWNNFGPRIFLEKEEFNDYVTRSPLGLRKKEKKMSAFVMDNICKYSVPKKSQKRVTPAGYYLPEPSS